MQVGDAELAQVAHPLADALQRPGEAVDVGDVPHGLLAVQPVRRDLALVVERAQLGIARRCRRGDRVQQGVPCLREPRIASVDGVQRIVQLGEEALETQQERAVPVDARQGLRMARADLRTHRVDVLHRAAQCRRTLRRGARAARRAPAAARARRSRRRGHRARARPSPPAPGRGVTAASSTVGCSGSGSGSARRMHSNARSGRSPRTSTRWISRPASSSSRSAAAGSCTPATPELVERHGLVPGLLEEVEHHHRVGDHRRSHTTRAAPFLPVSG